MPVALPGMIPPGGGGFMTPPKYSAQPVASTGGMPLRTGGPVLPPAYSASPPQYGPQSPVQPMRTAGPVAPPMAQATPVPNMPRYNAFQQQMAQAQMLRGR